MMCVVRIKDLPDFNMVNKVRQLRGTEQNLVLSTRTGGNADLYCTFGNVTANVRVLS